MDLKKRNKILIIDTLYPEMNNAILLSKDIESSEYMGTGKSYKYYLEMHDFEVEHVYMNFTKSKKKIQINKYLSYLYILIARIPGKFSYLHLLFSRHRKLFKLIKSFEPNYILNQDLNYLSQYYIKLIKKRNIKIIGEIASPLPPMYILREYDLILSSLPNIVFKLQKAGIKSLNFKLGFDPRILNNIDKREISNDLIFIGSFSRNHKKSLEIVKILSKVFKNFRFYGAINKKDLKKYNLENFYGGNAWGHKMYMKIYNSKIVVNRHSSIAESYSNNLRLYETTGMGALLITEESVNIRDIFNVSDEIITYKNYEDLVTKIHILLKDDVLRNKIALGGQRRTLKDHSYEIRMQELIKIILNI